MSLTIQLDFRAKHECTLADALKMASKGLTDLTHATHDKFKQASEELNRLERLLENACDTASKLTEKVRQLRDELGGEMEFLRQCVESQASAEGLVRIENDARGQAQAGVNAAEDAVKRAEAWLKDLLDKAGNILPPIPVKPPVIHPIKWPPKRPY